MHSSNFLLSRRGAFQNAFMGLGAVAISRLFDLDRKLVASEYPVAKPAKVERLIHIFLGGGLSQVDSFDYKPMLEKFHDKDLPADFKADAFFGKVGRLHQSHYKFKQRGNSGLYVSDLFPLLAEQADDLTIIRSMKAETANHIPGIFQANTGFRQMGYPALGAWMSFSLGSSNENLPTFVVLPDARGIPNSAGGAFNWTNGFLPAEHQGVAFELKGRLPVPYLESESPLSNDTKLARLKLLEQLNSVDADGIPAELADSLHARLQSYQLAARMQQAIPEAMDFSQETEATLNSYGIGTRHCQDTAKNCLAARRLVEKGVRLVQLWTGDGVSWDAHDNITGDGYKSHTGEAKRVEQPISALIQDLKQRGMLDSTLVMITTEFGRTPYAQSNAGTLSRGRDHHPEAFSVILAGGGLKRGFAFGETDDFGYHAIGNVVTWPDFHATILHLLGLDHEKLTFYYNGLDRRLTNVSGKVIQEIIA